MTIDLSTKSNDELEDMLIDLCGKLELDSKQVEMLQAVEAERERRQSGKAGPRKD